MSFEQLPQEFKQLRTWYGFRLEPRQEPGKFSKAPRDIKTGYNASWRDKETGRTLERYSFPEAVAALENGALGFDGIGFIFPDNGGLFGVDLDGVIDNAGNIEPWALEIVEALDSYTEYSVSGHGLHILCKGSLPVGGNRKGPVELYQDARFLTVTGKPYGKPRKLAERTQEAARVHAKYISAPAQKNAPGAAQRPQEPRELADDDLLRIMFNSPNGANIKALWDNPGGDHSANDMALVNHLLFWTYWDTGDVDLARVDRLFRRSGLMREKWDERRGAETYGQRTLNKALSGFTPPRNCRAQATAADFDDLDAPPVSSPPVGSEPPAPLEKKSAADIIDGFFNRVQSEIYKPISTSFSHLDDFLGGGLLVKSFVLIGAASSMGKTTFAQQMVENMAVQTGRDVVYFPLEMGVDALLSKSISRVSFEITKNAAAALRADEVLQGYKWGQLSPDQRDSLERARDFIKRRHTSVYYADLPNANADAFIATLERYKVPGKPAPFIVLDYIQLLQGGQRDDAAGTIKKATKALHDYAIANDTIVFAITAFNREATKSSRVSMESARDTSDLEYSMDYGFYLNFWDMENTKEMKQTDAGKPIIAPREELKNDKPRRISVKIVKNRLGPTDVRVGFKYYSAFNYFESASHSEMKAAYTAAEDARKWARMGVPVEYPEAGEFTEIEDGDQDNPFL